MTLRLFKTAQYVVPNEQVKTLCTGAKSTGQSNEKATLDYLTSHRFSLDLNQNAISLHIFIRFGLLSHRALSL